MNFTNFSSVTAPVTCEINQAQYMRVFIEQISQRHVMLVLACMALAIYVRYRPIAYCKNKFVDTLYGFIVGLIFITGGMELIYFFHFENNIIAQAFIVGLVFTWVLVESELVRSTVKRVIYKTFKSRTDV